jgi:predicted  nucleic acid-binding Zn-ribbon protein
MKKPKDFLKKMKRELEENLSCLEKELADLNEKQKEKEQEFEELKARYELEEQEYYEDAGELKEKIGLINALSDNS